jgi:hypothetical protein
VIVKKIQSDHEHVIAKGFQNECEGNQNDCEGISKGLRKRIKATANRLQSEFKAIDTLSKRVQIDQSDHKLTV